MTMRSPRRAGIALADARLTGVAERLDALAGALLVGLLAAVFLTMAFLSVVLFAVLVLAVAFLAVVFLALAFLAGVLFAGTVRLLTLTVHTAYFFAVRGGRPRLVLHATENRTGARSLATIDRDV
jgi:hypothetical protein